MKSLKGKSIEGLGRTGICRSGGSVFVLVVALGLGAGLPTPFLREARAQLQTAPSLTHAIELIVAASTSRQAARLAIQNALSANNAQISTNGGGAIGWLLGQLRSNDQFFGRLSIADGKRAGIISELEKAMQQTKVAVGQKENTGFKNGGVKIKRQATPNPVDLYAFANELSSRALVTATDGTVRFDLRNNGEEDLYQKLVAAIRGGTIQLPFSFFENACYRFSEGGLAACTKELSVQAYLKSFATQFDYQGNLLASLEDLSLVALAQKTLPATERTALSYFRSELDRVLAQITAAGFFGPYQQEVARHAPLAIVRGVLSQFEQTEFLADLGKLLAAANEEDRDQIVAEYVDALPVSLKNDAAFNQKLDAVVIASTAPQGPAQP